MFGQLLTQKQGTIAIGGHRGCGENLLQPTASGTLSRIEPAYRENTLASFKQAAALGVSFVEFDVQVTRDGVPVLWHDDEIVTQVPGQPALVTEVKDHSIAEFQALVRGSDNGSKTQLVRLFRNRETRSKIPKFAAWECQQDDMLPTLTQLFQVLPEAVGFDIEVKMTVPDHIPVTPAEEVDRVVLPILACVDACTQNSNRTIVYSSFDPDVCIKIAQYQNRYPVFFLSGCGIYPHVDPRRLSPRAAIEFAAAHNLAGVAVPAAVLMSNIDMVADAHCLGLKVMTYGLENNSMDVVEKQRQLGVHGAIVDDVVGVCSSMSSASSDSGSDTEVDSTDTRY